MAEGPGSTPLPANAHRIPIPAAALGPWLAEIDDPTELKVTLRTVAMLAEETSRGGVPTSVALNDLLDDKFLARGCAGGAIRSGLAAALKRETLVAVFSSGEILISLNDSAVRHYFDRAKLEPLSPAHVLDAAGEPISMEWRSPTQPTAQRANIFALHEEHIGSYGHNMAEQLKAAEADYPINWIQDALTLAKERNKINWNYVEGILRRWLKEGRYSDTEASASRQRDQRHEHGKLRYYTAPDSRKTNLDDYRERYGRLPWEPGEPDAG